MSAKKLPKSKADQEVDNQAIAEAEQGALDEWNALPKEERDEILYVARSVWREAIDLAKESAVLTQAKVELEEFRKDYIRLLDSLFERSKEAFFQLNMTALHTRVDRHDFIVTGIDTRPKPRTCSGPLPLPRPLQASACRTEPTSPQNRQDKKPMSSLISNRLMKTVTRPLIPKRAKKYPKRNKPISANNILTR